MKKVVAEVKAIDGVYQLKVQSASILKPLLIRDWHNMASYRFVHNNFIE